MGHFEIILDYRSVFCHQTFSTNEGGWWLECASFLDIWSHPVHGFMLLIMHVMSHVSRTLLLIAILYIYELIDAHDKQV